MQPNLRLCYEPAYLFYIIFEKDIYFPFFLAYCMNFS